MSVSARQETVTSTAESLVDPAGATNNDPQLVKLRVATGAASSLFVGGSGVTTSSGYEIAAGTSEDFVLGPDDELFGVASASITVGILQTRKRSA